MTEIHTINIESNAMTMQICGDRVMMWSESRTDVKPIELSMDEFMDFVAFVELVKKVEGE